MGKSVFRPSSLAPRPLFNLSDDKLVETLAEK